MAYSWTRTLATIFRRYNTDGVPASLARQPPKDEIRTWGTETEAAIADLDTRVGAVEPVAEKVAYNPTFNAGPPTTAQTGFSSDTYIVKSKLTIEDNKIQAGTRMLWRLHVSKTAAGTAAPAVKIRIGTAGDVSDSSRATLTFDTQTAATDEGVIDVELSFLVSGASGEFKVVGMLNHQNTTTGLSTKSVSIVSATSSTFNTTTSSLKAGLSLDAGSSANWTLDYVRASIENLA